MVIRMISFILGGFVGFMLCAFLKVGGDNQ